MHRSCILRSFTVDMVGFAEVLCINGASTTVKPILQDLLVCCSGDDGIVVSGKAQPLIRSCELRVRRRGHTLPGTASCAGSDTHCSFPQWLQPAMTYSTTIT